jgi:hypothetical protein
MTIVRAQCVFPNVEKASMVVRLTAAAGALGVGRVLASTDIFGSPRRSCGSRAAAPRRAVDLARVYTDAVPWNERSQRRR